MSNCITPDQIKDFALYIYIYMDRWDAEIENKIDAETMVTESDNEINKIEKALSDILIMFRGDVAGCIDEETNPLFIKIMDLIPRLKYESEYLTHFSKMNGTLTKFAEEIKVYQSLKYRSGLSPPYAP